MPPAIPIATSTGIVTGARIDFPVPTSTRPGDTYVMIVAAELGLVSFDFDNVVNAELERVEGVNLGTFGVWALRRTASEDDGSEISVEGDAVPAWMLPVLIVYRDLADAAAVESSGTAIAASTNFVCPSRSLTTYSDLYLGIAVVTSAATAVTPPAGSTERAEIQSGGRTLEVFDFFAEATGATGTKTATTGANQSGGAVSLAFAVGGLRGGNKTLVMDPPGMLGLPTEGV